MGTSSLNSHEFHFFDFVRLYTVSWDFILKMHISSISITLFGYAQLMVTKRKAGAKPC